jgi:hypothetical protein
MQLPLQRFQHAGGRATLGPCSTGGWVAPEGGLRCSALLQGRWCSLLHLLKGFWLEMLLLLLLLLALEAEKVA